MKNIIELKTTKAKLAVIITVVTMISAGCTPRNPQSSSESPRQEGSALDDRNKSNSRNEITSGNIENPSEDSPEDTTDAEDEPDELTEGQGNIKMGDSGYQVTVESPFKAQWNADMGSLFITVSDDVSFQGAFFHDTSDQGVQQLETMVKNMEDSYKSNPTITDFKQEVDKGENGLFSFTFTYSAGETEGSPAGFYYVHYQKTPTGLLTGNFSCPKLNYTDAVKKMFDSIVTETEGATKAPTA